jgi:transcriptional regulator with XRE-family HTH domain
MPAKTLSTLGAMVRKKRGDAKLRETAQDIGIGPATLMRVENGRIPDVATFGKLCKWLGEDPGSFLGFEQKEEEKVPEMAFFTAHLKIDQTPKKETLDALAKMIWFANKGQRGSVIPNQNEDA